MLVYMDYKVKLLKMVLRNKADIDNLVVLR